VRPDAATGLPWLLRSGVDLYADAAAMAEAPLRVPMPVARPMRVTYGEPSSESPDGSGVQGLPGALVRVFAVLDVRGALASDPDTMPPCLAVADLDATPCLQSLLQVAEGRTGPDGDFLLLLPPDVN